MSGIDEAGWSVPGATWEGDTASDCAQVAAGRHLLVELTEPLHQGRLDVQCWFGRGLGSLSTLVCFVLELERELQT